MSVKEEYISYCNEKKSLPLFHRAAWWNLVLENWQVEKVSAIEADAYLPYAFYKKWGFRFSRNPFLTPYSGLVFLSEDYSVEQKQALVEKAILFLEQFSISQYDSHPLLSQGIKSNTTKTTFLLPLDKSIEEIFSSFKSSLRRQIKKASKNLTIETSYDISAFHKIYLDSLQKQKSNEIVPKELISKTLAYCEQKNCGQLFVARSNNGSIHASIFYVFDQKCAYYLLGGSATQHLGSGAMGLLLWHCIHEAHKQQLEYFDFEGSEVPGVARFFSGFGGNKIDYPILSAKTDPKLKTLLKLKGLLKK